MAYTDPTIGLTVPGARQAPPAVVRRDNLGFAPGLRVMQPARDAQNLRDLRNTEAMADEQFRTTQAINADTENLRAFNQGTAANELAADSERARVAYETSQRAVPTTPASPYLPAQRGNYNMANTDPNALPKPVGAGLNFGFGGSNGTAQQYLDRMALQDRQARADSERTALLQDYLLTQQSITPQSSIGDIAAARSRLSAMAPILGLQVRNQGTMLDTNARTAAEAASDQVKLQAAQLTAGAGLAGRIGAAGIAGQYGLASAQERARGLLGAAAIKAQGTPGVNAKNQAEADMLGLRMALIQGELNNGNTAGAQALAVGQTPGAGKLINNAQGMPIGVQQPDGTVRPLTQAEIQQLSAANNQYLGK